MNWILGGIVVIALAAGGAYYVSMQSGNDMMEKDDAMMQDDVMVKKETMGDTMEKEEGAMMKDDGAMESGAMMQKGSYEDYAPEKLALANDGDVVLFFRASWCPTCKALDADIRAHQSAIPAGVTILDVDYDTHTALKQKYGVTYQHTLVQVDASGNLITKWSGGLALADLVSKIQ